jgi:hypothetical protein
MMMETRRKVLTLFCGALVPLSLGFRTIAQQQQRRPHPGGSTDPANDDAVPLKPAAKAILEENEKDIKKSVERLYQLAGDLKAEVEKTDSGKVLSLVMVKKAEEIEKLARDIKTRAKG